MTTNAVESWHRSLKAHAEGKGNMLNFSLAGIASHVLKIADQWEQRAQKEAELFRKTRIFESTEYPELLQFPGPVQQLIADQMGLATKLLSEGR